MVWRIVLTLLLLAMLPARSQTVPGPCGPVGAASIPVGALTAATCAPAPFGTGTLPNIRANSVGITGWMYCPPAGTGKWRLFWGAATWSGFAKLTLGQDAADIAAAPDKLVAFNAAVARNSAALPGVLDPAVALVWCPYWPQMLAGVPAPIVPPPAWVVAKNGSLATRPSFAFAGGKRAYVSATSVKVGAACDCAAAQLAEGLLTFCQTSPAFVAVCTKANP